MAPEFRPREPGPTLGFGGWASPTVRSRQNRGRPVHPAGRAEQSLELPVEFRPREVGSVEAGPLGAGLVQAWLEETARRRATSVSAVPGGFAVRHAEYPSAHDHNRVIIGAAVDASVLSDAADAALNGLTHRRIDVHSVALADAVSASLLARGYEREDDLLMQYVPAPPSIARRGIRIETLTLSERVAVATADWALTRPVDVARQLGERFATVVTAVTATFLGVCDADGAIVARADLYVRDGLAQVEEVWTNEEARRRGYASALVTEAVRRADGSGVFLIADANDWPKVLYRRLGFADLAHPVAFTRTDVAV